MREIIGRGRFQATREGFGFIRPEEGGPDLFVPPSETGGAFHSDLVEYRLVRSRRGGPRSEAHVIEIVERGVKRLTGVVAGTRRIPLLVPDHPRLPSAIRLIGPLAGIETGQRVLCRLQDTGGRGGPGAFLEEILGDADDPSLDGTVIAIQFGLPQRYPDEAVAEAERAAAALEAEPQEARRDFTSELVFTIDPESAADFDDAVSIRPAAGGGWRLRVHIADVSAAVAAGGPLDREARARGNSTYFPGSVIPMLPEALSSRAMSLRPGERKCVLTVSALLDREGGVRGVRLDEGLIRSRARLTYEQAQESLEGRASLGRELDAALRAADELAQCLRKRRLERGAFDLTVPEAQVELDEKGRPVAILRRLSGRSHQLIEEFMILANRITCHYAHSRGHPFLYRIHEPPDPTALDEFRRLVPLLAPDVRMAEISDLAGLRRWLAALPPGPRTWQIHALFLRSLKRASYADHDRGHFGLGLRGYGHFTSPIRRYPDLFNHRVIRWAIRNGSRPVPEEWRAEAEELGMACTATEQLSEEAEREIVRVKSLRWAEERTGEIFRGRVTATVKAGAFVEFDDIPVEGLIPKGEELAAMGHSRRRRPSLSPLQIGDAVIVQIARVSLRERTLLLALRSAGRRVRSTEPEALESWADPFGGRQGEHSKRRKPARTETDLEPVPRRSARRAGRAKAGQARHSRRDQRGGRGQEGRRGHESGRNQGGRRHPMGKGRARGR
ncbi:MAG: VacB/RNase II family 3'-5' exoribonuclease [Candidatus Eisenbacteria bacterium]|nr:VacB/RNase II family 3'-5' exoribonuclease [Candidatus Eisenbacteria bacterium]